MNVRRPKRSARQAKTWFAYRPLMPGRRQSGPTAPFCDGRRNADISAGCPAIGHRDGQAMGKRVAATVTGVASPDRVLVPVQFALDLEEASAARDRLPRLSLRVAKERNAGTLGRRLQKPPRQFRDLLPDGNRQGAAVFAEVVEPSRSIVAVPLAQGMVDHAPLAILEIFGADPGHQPVLVPGRPARVRGVGYLHLGQGRLGGLLVPLASDPLTAVVEKWHPLLRAGRGVVPAIGLFPMHARRNRVVGGLVFGFYP